jgi:hypothetical protein
LNAKKQRLQRVGAGGIAICDDSAAGTVTDQFVRGDVNHSKRTLAKAWWWW